MSLGFGLLSAQLRPGESDWSDAYSETVKLAVEAERLGFSSVWTTEHHFVDDGYMPSLLVVSAALAAATTAIEIGTGVLLAPLHDPVRLAEDAATVQLLSAGRLTLGLGLGWNPIEFEALGADIRRRGRAMAEILEILPQAWSGKPVRHQGSVYQLPEVVVRPTPSTPIPIVIGGGAEAAVRRAARLADGFFSNAPSHKLVDQVHWINDELDKTGRDPSSFRLIHYSIVYPGDTDEQSWADGEPHIWQTMWKYGDMEASATRSGPPPLAPELTATQREKLRQRSLLVGPPDKIVAQLHQIRDATPFDVEFVARSFFPTMTYDRQVELMQRLAEEVAPHV